MMSKSILVIDGATGTELRTRGVRVPDYRTSAWSALALLEAPDAVRELHLDYLEAGADIITANSYSLTPVLLSREGLDHRLHELATTAGRLACEARAARPLRGARIAGSIAPIDITYRPDLVPSDGELVESFGRLAGYLDPYVDLFLGETYSTIREAHAAVRAIAPFGKPIWIAWCIDPETGRLFSGEDLAEASASLHGMPVQAVLCNCAPPASLTEALPRLRAATSLLVGAYGNPEGDVQVTSGSDPGEYCEAVSHWLDAGADIIGGCCGTSPEHIRRLRRLVDDRGQNSGSAG